MNHNSLYLAIQLPGFPSISPVPGLKPEFVDLGSFISPLLNIALYMVLFWAFVYLVWGGFQYMMAGGKKEDLAKARARITWAIIGLIVVMLAYFIAKFAAEILPPQGGLSLFLPKPAYAACVEPEKGVQIGECFGYGNINSLGEGISKLVAPVFSVAAALVVIYFLRGAFKYLKSGGSKEEVEGAREIITHAIIGFIILMFAFLILQFLLASLFGVSGLRIF